MVDISVFGNKSLAILGKACEGGFCDRHVFDLLADVVTINRTGKIDSMDKEFDVAFSFAGEDRKYVEDVANFLKAKGIKVFYDRFEETDLWGKDCYQYFSRVYQEKAQFVIIFISKHYKEKYWTNHELKAAQARALQQKKEYLLPVKFDETEIDGLLPTIGHLSANEREPGEIANKIIDKLVKSGFSVPSELTRKSTYNTISSPSIDPTRPKITITSSNGKGISKANIVAIAEKKDIIIEGMTDDLGFVELKIPVRQKYNLLIAHKEYLGKVIKSWDPQEDLKIGLLEKENFSSIIITGTGYIPGLNGRLNPILDNLHRTYLYADNIAIDGGKQQPVYFQINSPFTLEDVNGVVMEAKVLHIQGRGTCLLEYRQYMSNSPNI